MFFIAVCTFYALLILSAIPSPVSGGGIGEVSGLPGATRLDDSTVQLGKILLHEATGVLDVPAEINMSDGLIELLACSRWGKVHESLFVIDEAPHLLQTGLLLLLGKPDFDPTPDAIEDWVGGSHSGCPAVDIEVAWTDSAGTAHRAAVETMLVRSGEEGPIAPGQWLFTGSLFQSGVFQAQTTGTLIATFFDPVAIINFAGEKAFDDEAFTIRRDDVPTKGTKVMLHFRGVERATVSRQ